MIKILLIVLILYSPGAVLLGQDSETFDYHRQESPAISWNGSYLYDARLLSLGGISFFPSKPFQATLNPANIPEGGKWSFGVTYNSSGYEAFQYWGINQGVTWSTDNQSDKASQISGAAGLIKFGKFSISAGWYLADRLQYPDFDISWDYGGYSGDFSGQENSFFTALAWELNRNIRIGANLIHVSGTRRLLTTLYSPDYKFDEINQTWRKYDIYIEQQETHQRSHWSLAAGTSISLNRHWTLAMAAHLPLTGKVTREVDRRFRNPTVGIDLTSPQQGRDELNIPKRVLLGNLFSIPLKVSKHGRSILRLGVEARHTFWQEYELIFFNEEIPRDMRNTTELAIGFEFCSLAPKRDLFLRLAFRLDPQPVKKPATTLNILSGGIGLKIRGIRTDLALAYITTTTDSPAQSHLIFNASLGISL